MSSVARPIFQNKANIGLSRDTSTSMKGIALLMLPFLSLSSKKYDYQNIGGNIVSSPPVFVGVTILRNLIKMYTALLAANPLASIGSTCTSFNRLESQHPLYNLNQYPGQN